MWSMPDLVAVIARGLHDYESQSVLEQAPYGLDALYELDIHPIVGEAILGGTGLGVFAEVPYPSPGRGKTRRTERERCDLVLTEAPDRLLGDPISEQEREAEEASTLFANALAPPDVVAPEDALWLEVKVVEQFGLINGMCGPNHGYSGAFSACRDDIAKLASDPRIRFAALLIVLFTADEPTGRHDMGVFANACLDRGLSIASIELESFAISDRLGNACCTVALTPIRGLGWDL